MNKTVIMQFTTRVLSKSSYLFIRKLLVVFLFVFVGSNVFAQPTNTITGDVTMPTPNAAALGKYSDIPVSHYTGANRNYLKAKGIRHSGQPLGRPAPMSHAEKRKRKKEQNKRCTKY